MHTHRLQTLKGRIAGITPVTEDVCPGVENIDLSPMIASVSVSVCVCVCACACVCVCVCVCACERGREGVSGWVKVDL